MVSPGSKPVKPTEPPPPPATETQSISPRARQAPQQQCQRQLSSPLSRSRSLSPNSLRLSAPHSTIITERVNDEVSIRPSSPDGNQFGSSSATASTASTASTNRPDGTTSFEVGHRSCSSSNAVNDDDDESSGRSSCNNDVDGARKRRRVVVVVEPDVVSLRGGAGVNVQATGAVVRWGTKSKAGKQLQPEEDNDGRREDRIEADRSRASSSPTITFLSDDTDDPPVTRRILSDGEPFRRPGRYTYIVSSGPLTVGRVVVSEAPNGVDTDRYIGKAMAVGNDVDSDSVAAASLVMPGRTVKPEKVLAAAAGGGVTPAGAPQACAPPEEEKVTADKGGCQGRSDNGNDSYAPGSQDLSAGQGANDEHHQQQQQQQQQRQQQQQQDVQEEEEQAMAADELSPVHPRNLPQPLEGLGESSAFSPLSENEAPWRGDRAATETAEDSCETATPEDTAAEHHGPLSLLRAPPSRPSLTLSTYCDDADDSDDNPVIISERLVEQNESVACLPPIAPPPSLNKEGGGQMARRGIGEGTPVNPTAEALPDDCDRRDRPVECLVPVEEVGEAEMEVAAGDQKGCKRRESPENEDRECGNDDKSDPADHGCDGGARDKGEHSVLHISSSSSEAGETITPPISVPATSNTSGECTQEVLTTVASFRPKGDVAEPDPLSQTIKEFVVDMRETRLVTTATGVASTPEPLGCAKTTALALSSSGGFTGGVGEIDCEITPDGVLSDNSFIDSDDGTAATSQSAKGGAREDKRPSLPRPLSPEPTPCGASGYGDESSYLPGAALKPRVPQFSRPLQVEPVPSSDEAETQQGDGGMTRQEWHAGMSPLTSPAVGERLGGDDHGGFGHSDCTDTAFSPRAATSDHASEDGQRLSAFKIDRGLDNGEHEAKDSGVPSTSERAGMVESAAASLEVNEHDNDGRKPMALVKVVGGASSLKCFDPEKVRVAVGTTVVWELDGGVIQDGNGNDAGPVYGSFSVRGDTPLYDNGFVTECEFSLGPHPTSTFSHPFNQDGLFIMCSKTSPSDDGQKRGELLVYSTTCTTPTSEYGKKRSDIHVGRTESLSQSQGDSSSFDPDSASADLEGFPSDIEGNSNGSHASFERDQRSASTRSDIQLNSPTVSNCSVSDDRSSSSDAQGARATLSTESDVRLRGFSTTDVPARRSVGTTAPPELGMDKAILAATAAATVGQAKSVADSLRISSVGRHRGLSPLVGVHATGDAGGRIGTGDETGWPPGRECVLGRVSRKPSGGGSSFTEPLSTAVVVSPQGAYPTSNVLLTMGTSKQGDQYSGDGVDGVSSGRGWIRSDKHNSLEETNLDGNKATHLEAHELEPRAPRVNAAVQSGEPLSPPNSAMSKVSPDASIKRELVTSADAPVGADEKGVTAVVGKSQEGERVGHVTDTTTSKSKKKKSKKKKKKSGGGSGAGGSGDGGIGGGVGGAGGHDGGSGENGCTGWAAHRVSGSDAVKVGGNSQNDSAVLIDEKSFSRLFADGAMGVREGGNGKPVAKTLIVGDQGFKPTKALVVQAEAAVSIKVTSVRRNRIYGQDRALSISLEIPVVHTLERFVEGLPRQTVLKKTNAFGEPLVAVFRRSGEYWLVDHLSGKRLKVTVTERPEDLLQAGVAAAAGFHASAAPCKGRKDGQANSSLSRNVDPCSSEGGKNAGGERVVSSSRSKKKNKGKDKLAVATSTTAAAAVLAASTVATSTKEALDRTEAATLGTVPVAAHGSEAPAGATKVTPALPLPLPLLPPIRVKEGGDGLSLDELVEYNEAAKHSALEGVHVVNVSHRRGFEPAMLEVGLTPGLGACVMCDLDFQQQVTREVVCRRLLCKQEGSNSASVVTTSSGGREGQDASNPRGTTNDHEGVGKDTEEDEDDPNVKTARLGPGSLRKCHFILGQFGTYRLSYRNEANKGLSVVVRPPLLSDEGKDSARDGGMVQSPSTGDRADSVVKLPSPVKLEVSGEDEHQACAEDEAVSSDNDTIDATSGPMVTSMEHVEPLHERSADDSSSSNLATFDQWPSVGESSAVEMAAAGGSFSLEFTTDCDHGQGGFVHQRSQVKKKNKRLKRSTAAAAAAAAAAVAKKAATKKATAVAESVTGIVMDERADRDQAMGSSAPALPRDDAAVGVSRAAATLLNQRETRSAITHSQSTAVCGDNDTAVVTPVSKTVAQMPTSTSQDADIPAKGFCAEVHDWEEPATVDVLSAVSAAGADTAQQNDSGHQNASPTAGTLAPVAVQEATKRGVGAGKLKKGGPVRVGSSGDTDRAALKKCAPSVPTAAATVLAEKEEEERQEVAAPTDATDALAGRVGASVGRRVATRASWSGKKVTNVPSYERVRATSAGWNPSDSTSPAGTLPRACQPDGDSLSRRWDNPPAVVFTGSHPSQRNFRQIEGKGLGAPFVPGRVVQPTSGGSGEPAALAQPRMSGVESGGRNPAHVGGDGPSGWDSSASTAIPGLMSPEAAATAPGAVSSRTEPSNSHRSVMGAAHLPCPPKGVSDVHHSLVVTESIGFRATADKDTLPRPHSISGQPVAVNAQSQKGNYTGRRDKTRAEGSGWSSARTGATEHDRSRASEQSLDPPESTFTLSVSSAVDPRVTASKSRKKQKKKAKAAERKAAERKTMVVSAAEEPLRMSVGKPGTFSSSRLSEPSSSFSRRQPPVVVPRVMSGACSPQEAIEVGTGGQVSRATPVAVHPGTSFGNSEPLGQVATVNHANEIGVPTSVSSRTNMPLAMPASRAADLGSSSKSQGSMMRASSLPGSHSGGWTSASRGERGEAEGEGFAVSAETVRHAIRGGRGGAGPDRAPRGGLGHPPPPGLARSRVEADGGWGSAATAATVVTSAPTPTGATLPQAGTKPLSRPPPPGFGDGGRPPAARAPPYGDVEPPAASAMESTTHPAAISTPGPTTTVPVIPTPEMTVHSIGSAGVGHRGTQNAAQQGGTGFGNCSTKVSFDERSRRSRVLRAGATPFFPAAHAQSRRRGYRPAQAKPSPFPEGSRLPGGGYYVEEGPDDTLPPPSAYEVQEAAYMIKVFDDMMGRLRTTGMDETLPNGFTPMIYDFTDGVCC